MPVIGGGDGDGVDVLALHDLAQVGTGIDPAANLRGLGVEDRAIHVAQRDQAHPLDGAQGLDVDRALAAEADLGHADIAIGADDLRPRRSGEIKRGGADHGGFDEVAAGKILHDSEKPFLIKIFS